jgi:threonine dehydrogenase-like Zn-dependent dehydrogenase
MAPVFADDVCMQLAILGTGAVGPALGKAFSRVGHDVVIGTRDPEQARQREQWAGVDLPLAAYQDLDAEVFINATNGAGALPALQAVGDALNGKVVIDASNPASLAADLGWTDVFDLGDLTAARGLEMYLPLWVRMFSLIGRSDFNIKVVR